MISEYHIINEAKDWVGTKYKHQGRVKKNSDNMGGVDCIGYILGVSQKLGVQSKLGKPIELYDKSSYNRIADGVELETILDMHLTKVNMNQMRFGDIFYLKFCNKYPHVGFIGQYYIDKSFSLLHAYLPAGEVVEHHLSNIWLKRIISIYRFF